MTTIFTTMQNDLVDDQRAMDRMDADWMYDLDYVNSKVEQYSA
jgi:hypothetical protein